MSDARLDLPTTARAPFAAMLRLEASIELDPTIRELVKVRASLINGCAYCIDMHWKDARARGESEERLYMLDAWAESPLYSERERAALELCDAVTLVRDGHVPAATWERAAAVYPTEELGQLLFAIASINAWNMLMIASRAEPGHYRPAAGASLT